MNLNNLMKREVISREFDFVNGTKIFIIYLLGKYLIPSLWGRRAQHHGEREEGN